MRPKIVIPLLTGVAVLAWTGTTVGVSFEQVFAPPSGRGPIVLVLSGANGPKSVEHQAAKVAHLGYYAVLLDGRDFHPTTGKSAEEELRRVIERAQGSPTALPGKVAIIGFSRGGGGALTYAAPMGDVVSAIVAYYPVTIYVSNMRDFVGRFQVPILVMAGEQDGYCPLDSLQAMEAAAQEGQKLFELVIYPRVEHAFAARGTPYRPEDAAAWQRTTKMLSQYHPLRAQAAAPAPKLQLPSGETVWDLSGDWDTLIENYGPGARHGTGPNVYRITQTGSTFHAIRTNDDPLLTKEISEHGHAPWGRAGSPSLQGEVEKTGFEHVQIVYGSGGRVLPSTGHISEDGKKIVIDNGLYIKVTLTRP
jgi:alpha-beta hydrolase superfamily lysophospholipase